MRRAISKLTLSAVLSAGLLGVFAAPAAAQDVAVTGGVDFTNQYNFRGIRQNFAGMAIWPRGTGRAGGVRRGPLADVRD